MKPLVRKRYIDDIFLRWTINREDIIQFIEQANNHHPTIKFTVKISETETTFLDISIYKGERSRNNAVLDLRTHLNRTETFQYTHFSSCHPPGVKSKCSMSKLVNSKVNEILYIILSLICIL